MSGRQQRPSRGGAALSSRPRPPYRLWLPGTGTPEVLELQPTCARSPFPRTHARGIPGVARSPVPGKMPCLPPAFSAPSRFRKSFKPRSQSGCPSRAPPPPLPLAEAASRPAPSSAPTPRGTLISVTTWEDSLGAGDTRSHPPAAPSRRPPRATALREPHSHKCCFQLIARAGEGKGPGRRPRPEAGARLVWRCVRSAAACSSTTPACKFEM